jgi:2-hydroxychromene-2-carboxylate isomerase
VAWPEPWPNDGLLAMRAASAADSDGVGRAFLLAAMRVAFRDGRNLEDAAAVADAAREAGLDADGLLARAVDPDVRARLRERTEEALAAGVFGVPTVVVGDEVFWGDDRLVEAAQAAGRAPTGG